MLQCFSKDVKVTRVKNAVAAGTTDVDGDVLDMSGYDAVAFVGLLGDVTATSVLSIEGRESDASNGSGSVQVTDSKTADYTATASDADNKLLISDVVRPNKRYVFPRLKRGTANAVVDGILAIQYRTGDLPVTQGSTVLAQALSSPEV